MKQRWQNMLKATKMTSMLLLYTLLRKDVFNAMSAVGCKQADICTSAAASRSTHRTLRMSARATKSRKRRLTAACGFA